MKKLYSLLKASMTSGMNLFKIKTKKNSKRTVLIPIFIAGYLMFMIWCGANALFEKIAPMHIQYILLSLSVFGISIMTIIEGIYKASSLIFNCKDDNLLLSLPIKKRTVLFVRIFKFYVFELMFNSLFLLPIMIAYIRWADNLNWTYYLTSVIMLFMLPIIPIVISCFIGVITSSISSHFKYKNMVQIVLSMILIISVMALSYNTEGLMNYLMKHATSINDLITKIYYPAGVYAKLVTDFKVIDLLIFIVNNLAIYTFAIYILSKFYFKINSRMKKVVTNKKIKIGSFVIKQRTQTKSLIKKELNTFFKTPVFIINSGFALVLFLLASFIIPFKFESMMPILTEEVGGLGLSKDTIMSNISVLIFLLISFVAYLTSITNSVISLEGKNINILKSLPIKIKTILMSKIYACMVITTPVLLLGDIILCLKFKTKIIDAIILLILSILTPLVSHFIGIIVNLKFPKLDYENATEVVKQSASSFISVMIGMILFIISAIVITNIIGKINATLLLMLSMITYIIIDIILYLYLINKGVKDFNNLSV